MKGLFIAGQSLTKKPGLAEAVKMAGLELSGVHHCGIDDARNIAQLLPYIFGDKRI